MVTVGWGRASFLGRDADDHQRIPFFTRKEQKKNLFCGRNEKKTLYNVWISFYRIKLYLYCTARTHVLYLYDILQHVKWGGSDLNFFFVSIYPLFRIFLEIIPSKYTKLYTYTRVFLGTEPLFIKKIPPKCKTLISHHIHYITFMWERSEEEYESTYWSWI